MATATRNDEATWAIRAGRWAADVEKAVLRLALYFLIFQGLSGGPDARPAFWIGTAALAIVAWIGHAADRIISARGR